MSITEFLKKDMSFKRKPSPNAEATAPTQENTEKKESPKRKPKQAKTAAPRSNGRHKQLVGLSIGASELAPSALRVLQAEQYIRPPRAQPLRPRWEPAMQPLPTLPQLQRR